MEQFAALAALVQPIVGEGRLLWPGTGFGPIRGKARGTFGDFAWVNPWTPLLRESVWKTLRENGIILNGAPADLDFGKVLHEPLIELEAPPTAVLWNKSEQKACAVCGRWMTPVPETIIIDGASFDETIPLQRILEATTVLIANETFAHYIQEKGLRDVLVTPIEVR